MAIHLRPPVGEDGEFGSEGLHERGRVVASYRRERVHMVAEQRRMDEIEGKAAHRGRRVEDHIPDRTRSQRDSQRGSQLIGLIGLIGQPVGLSDKRRQ